MPRTRHRRTSSPGSTSWAARSTELTAAARPANNATPPASPGALFVHPGCSRSSGGLGEHHDPDLRHVLHRPTQAYEPEHRVLPDPIGPVVGALVRDVVDDDP